MDSLAKKKTDPRVIIRPGQKVVVVDPITHKRHYNKGSVESAFSFGIYFGSGGSYTAVHYITGIRQPKQETPKVEVQGAKENEIEIQSGVYLEVKK